MTSTRPCRIFTLLQWRLGTLLLGGTASLSSMPPFVQPFTQLEPSSAGLRPAGMGQVEHSTHPAGVLRTPVKHMDSVLL